MAQQIFSKKDLIESMALCNDIETKAQAGRIIDHIVETLAEAIVAGKDTVIPGIGTAKVVQREARVATKPGTTEKVNVPAKKVVKIKATAPLNRLVNA